MRRKVYGLRFSIHRVEMAGEVGGRGHVQRRRRPRAREVLLPGDVPVPERRAPHGAPQELLDRRHADAFFVEARPERPSPDRLRRLRHACRERRHKEQDPGAQVDLGQHRVHDRAAQAHGVQLRLAAQDRDVQPGLLQVDPVDLPPVSEKGAGIQEERACQLVRELRHGAG